MKNTFKILLFACLTGNAIASESLDKGLTLHLSWNDSMEASTAAGIKTPTKDQSTQLVEGKSGKGVELTGSARLYYPGKDNFNIQEGTIAFWAKRNASWKQEDEGFILVKAIAGKGWNQDSFYFSITPHNQIRVWIWDHEKKQTLYMVSPVPAQANVWYHLAATFTDGEVRIYVNGEEGSYTGDGKGDPMMVMPSGDVKHLQIGSDYNHAFEGVMDEFRVYNRVLSPEEIKALYNL
ncbi:LamG domain-containing protein [Kiritimatiellaeota bacterium B1221]|nr:LamG domain-containing protein [Kiritimatiellaeota bacterium B1221]